MKNKTILTFSKTVFTFFSYGLRKHATTYSYKRNHFLFFLFLSFFCISENELKAQHSYKVLFLGNSYTGVNNLPQMVHDVAFSAGDTLIFESHSPGAYQLIDHSTNAISQNKIMSGSWDYVVIQGQSQEPIVAHTQFSNGGIALYKMIKQYNPCAVTVAYMTWGRKNGDASTCASFPEMCTYQGMDTNIRNRYLDLTAFINGEVSPVSVVWNYLRKNYPSIELYQADESHPSLEGSYAAACCFYSTLFKKDPRLITYNFGLKASDAAIIKNAVKTQVFDKLALWDFKKPPISNFSYTIGSGINEVFFTPISKGVQQTYLWDFGDGDTSSAVNPIHSYLTDGTYKVSLTTKNCDLLGWHSSFTDTIIQFCSHTPSIYTTHPWLCNFDTLWTQEADSYQWFAYGLPLPETNQYLANYSKYSSSGFSVIATIAGCSELSQLYAETALSSGYYFDAIGDPCMGDTVAFAVLHWDGFLSGSESILWYKNDTLLPLMTNEDTLFISTSGKYLSKVINTHTKCPMDTTYATQEYHCEVVGIKEKDQKLFWSIYPNPVSETITIKFRQYQIQEEIQIYNAIGGLTKVIAASGTTTLSIADLPNGLYFVRLKNSKQSPLKFIKQ